MVGTSGDFDFTLWVLVLTESVSEQYLEVEISQGTWEDGKWEKNIVK